MKIPRKQMESFVGRMKERQKEKATA